MTLVEQHSDAVSSMLKEGCGDTEIGLSLGLSRKTVYRIRKSLSGKPYQGDARKPLETVQEFREEDGDTIKFRADVKTPIRTLKELEAVCKVDMSKWRVKKWSCKSWTTAMATGSKGDKKSELVQNYSVSADFERLTPRSFQMATDAIFSKMKSYAPKYKSFPSPKVNDNGYLAVVAILDAHFGKLSWTPETGESYDLKIVEKIYRNAVTDLMEQAKSKHVERFMIPIGNDFYQCDNSNNTTKAGTPQDVDGRYAKMIEAGESAVIEAIERLMVVAPVDVILCAGNHDTTTSYHLARTVNAWFHNCSRVNVDCGPSFRKYYKWKSTLIGLTHGNEEKIASLPAIMAQERPKEWSETNCREWLLGHMHRSRTWQTQPTDTFDGTTIRVLRSISAQDAWHSKRGYINSPTSRCAELYWYGKNGYAGHSIANARE